MKLEQIIKEKLEKEFQPVVLNIHNESAKHAGHSAAGEETHFFIEIVSKKFSGLSHLARHRMVNAYLSQELKEKVHALALKLKSPEEL